MVKAAKCMSFASKQLCLAYYTQTALNAILQDKHNHIFSAPQSKKCNQQVRSAKVKQKILCYTLEILFIRSELHTSHWNQLLTFDMWNLLEFSFVKDQQNTPTLCSVIYQWNIHVVVSTTFAHCSNNISAFTAYQELFMLSLYLCRQIFRTNSLPSQSIPPSLFGCKHICSYIKRPLSPSEERSVASSIGGTVDGLKTLKLWYPLFTTASNRSHFAPVKSSVHERSSKCFGYTDGETYFSLPRYFLSDKATFCCL